MSLFLHMQKAGYLKRGSIKGELLLAWNDNVAEPVINDRIKKMQCPIRGNVYCLKGFHQYELTLASSGIVCCFGGLRSQNITTLSKLLDLL